MLRTEAKKKSNAPKKKFFLLVSLADSEGGKERRRQREREGEGKKRRERERASAARGRVGF